MSYRSLGQVNQVLNVLLARMNTTSNNPATSDLNMNGYDITNANTITCDTLNYTTLNPPISPAMENLSQVLVNGNSAGLSSINMNANAIISILSEKYSSGINLTDQSSDAQISSNNTGNLQLTCSNDLLLDVNGTSIIELKPSLLTITSPNINIPNGYLTITPHSSLSSSSLLLGEIAIDASSNNINIYDGKYWNRVTSKHFSFGYNNQLAGLNANQITFNFTTNNATITANSMITLHLNSVFTITNSSTLSTTTIMISGMIVTLNIYNIIQGTNTSSIYSYQTSTSSTSCAYADLGMIKILEDVTGTWNLTYGNSVPYIQVNNFAYNTTTKNGTCNITIFPAPLLSGFTGYKSCSNGVIELKSDIGFAKPYNSQFIYTPISLN